MSDATHTPGPWEWVGNDLEAPEAWRTEHEHPITVSVECMSHCYGGTAKLEMSEANARLIARAPTMLALLQEVAAHFDGTDSPLGQRVRDEIAKAKGAKP